MGENLSQKKARSKKIISLLKKEYKGAWTTLNYSTPFQLLIATILSAQCTDARINKITPALFAKFPDAKSLAAAPLPEIESLIRPSGFYKNKAKNIKKTAQILYEKHGGKVPNTMEHLLELAGVARKTANIVLFHAFSKSEGIAVDTHCMRLSHRLGFTSTRRNQQKIEKELMALLEKNEWGMYTNWMVLHGRKYCTARSPKCGKCPLRFLCPKKGV
ncbi:endonuclease III [Candidatus Micrarchaeota archaeon CG10_big_fil_rev_8_21_14_0_10_45_29]|nr:MAG: endonuclease III [Candidatus Micrarchaeota archaeon CG10_big_fil_rev_8_21_14_0_10_45_29]